MNVGSAPLDDDGLVVGIQLENEDARRARLQKHLQQQTKDRIGRHALHTTSAGAAFVKIQHDAPASIYEPPPSSTGQTSQPSQATRDDELHALLGEVHDIHEPQPIPSHAHHPHSPPHPETSASLPQAASHPPNPHLCRPGHLATPTLFPYRAAPTAEDDPEQLPRMQSTPTQSSTQPRHSFRPQSSTPLPSSSRLQSSSQAPESHQAKAQPLKAGLNPHQMLLGGRPGSRGSGGSGPKGVSKLLYGTPGGSSAKRPKTKFGIRASTSTPSSSQPHTPGPRTQHPAGTSNQTPPSSAPSSNPLQSLLVEGGTPAHQHKPLDRHHEAAGQLHTPAFKQPRPPGRVGDAFGQLLTPIRARPAEEGGRDSGLQQPGHPDNHLDGISNPPPISPGPPPQTPADRIFQPHPSARTPLEEPAPMDTVNPNHPPPTPATTNSANPLTLLSAQKGIQNQLLQSSRKPSFHISRNLDTPLATSPESNTPLNLLSHQKALHHRLLESLPPASSQVPGSMTQQQGRGRGVGGAGLAGRLQRLLAAQPPAPTAEGSMVATVQSTQYEGHLLKCRCACPTLPSGTAFVLLQSRTAHNLGVNPGIRLQVVPPWTPVDVPGSSHLVVLAFNVVVV